MHCQGRIPTANAPGLGISSAMACVYRFYAALRVLQSVIISIAWWSRTPDMHHFVLHLCKPHWQLPITSECEWL